MPQMNQSTFPQEAVLLDDNYPAKLLRIEEYEKTYDGVVTPKLAWIFGVKANDNAIDPDIEYEAEHEGALFEIGAYTSFATGETSNFYKLGFPNVLPENWSGDTDELVGMTCTARVTSYTRDDKTRNVIDKVSKPKKGKAKAAAKTEAEVNEEDFADLPF